MGESSAKISRVACSGTEARLFVSKRQVEQIKQKFKLVAGSNRPFADFYFKPKCGKWSLDGGTVRIREGPDRVHSIVLGFPKKNVKFRLFSGSYPECESVMQLLGFERWFTIRRSESQLWKDGPEEIWIENIENVGWTIELEGNNKREIALSAKKLGFRPSDLIWAPLSKVYLKRNSARR